MAAAGVRAGRAFVELGVDDRIQQGLQRARARLLSFGRTLSVAGVGVQAVGTAITAPFIASAVAFAKLGSQLDDIAARTGLTVEAFSELSFLAQQAGAGSGTLEKSFRRMAVILAEAGSGSATASDALATIGVRLEELQGLTPDEQFARLADGIAAVEDPSIRAASAMEIFGRSGAELLPLLRGGSASIAALRREAQLLGVSFNGADAAIADRLGDTLDAIGIQARFAFLELGASIAPVMLDAVQRVSRVLGGVIAWLRANRELVASVFAVGAAITVVGSGILALGATFIAAGLAVGGVSLALGAIVSVAKLAAAAVAGAFAFIASPIGLATVAIVGFVAAVVAAGAFIVARFTPALDLLASRLGALRETLGSTVGGLADALLAGDVPLAAQILWSGVRLAFDEGRNAVLDSTLGLVGSIASAWLTLTTRLTQAWQAFIGFVRSSIADAKFSVVELGLELVEGKDSAAAQVALALARVERDRAKSEARDTALSSIATAEKQLRDQLAAITIARSAVSEINDAKLEEARAKLEALIADAQRAREERERGFAQVARERPAVVPEFASDAVSQSVLGTFSGARIASLGTGNLFVSMDRTMKRVADDVNAIRRNTEELDGVEFGS